MLAALRGAGIGLTDKRYVLVYELARKAWRNGGRDGQAALTWIQKVARCSLRYAKILKHMLIDAGLVWFERDQGWLAKAPGERGEEPPSRFRVLFDLGRKRAAEWIAARRRQLAGGAEIEEQLVEEQRAGTLVGAHHPAGGEEQLVEEQHAEGLGGDRELGDEEDELGGDDPPPKKPKTTSYADAFTLLKDEYEDALKAQKPGFVPQVPTTLSKRDFYAYMPGLAAQIETAQTAGLTRDHFIAHVVDHFLKDPGRDGALDREHHPFHRLLEDLHKHCAWYAEKFIAPRAGPRVVERPPERSLVGALVDRIRGLLPDREGSS